MMNIVVVGGGAGGLELATSLGRKLGKKNKARITLVDRNRTHLWKPLLHEVATGSMDAGIDALSYQSHAKNHGFEFQLGSLTDIKRDEKRIVLAPIHRTSEAQYRFWDHHLPLGRVAHLHLLELRADGRPGKVSDLFEGTPYELSRADPCLVLQNNHVGLDGEQSPLPLGSGCRKCICKLLELCL